MMQPIAKFLVFAALICFGQAEVKLSQGVNTTVSFEGDELSIQIYNPQTLAGELKLCLKSTSDTKVAGCPEGYAAAHLFANQGANTFQLNRQGLFIPRSVGMSGSVVFESNGHLNLILASITNMVTVTLTNAEIPVITTTTTTTETAEKKESDKMAIIGIICGVSGLLLLLFIIGCVLLYFCWYKKRTHQPVPTTVPEEVHRTRDDTREIEEPLIPKVVVETPAPRPVKRPLKPSATTTTTTRKTSTSTTPASEDKPQIVAPKAAPRTPVVQPSDLVSLTSDATQMDESVVTPKRKSRKSKKASRKSKKSRRRRSKTPNKTPVKKHDSPSLPVDRTQSPTMPSTQATPDYPNDELTNALADSSHYKNRDYLKRSEAPLPGSTRSRSRSRPIVDEVDDYKLQTESILCFCQRNGRLDGHHHMMITDRVNLKRPHTISVAERTLLKANPKDAPELADIVVDAAEKAMAPLLEGRPISFDESHLLWTHFNFLETPISDSYIAIYRLMPSLFTLETPSLADPLVRKMPITGLYTLLLDRRFPRTFRVNLAAEIRDRASRILPRVQMYQMKSVAFPTNYLMLIYNKNKEAFVQGKEIHSIL